ncbi:MAG: transporter substrate-binding domain-containing protein [Rickettsiales bacterium]|nr:MAG: transporter substrate-binding domain-containing protein [Rickettsiales bacterium]
MILVMIFTAINLSNARELIVGISAIRPPFMYVNEKNEIVGFDPEVARTIAKKMGHTVKFQNMDFAGLIPSLTTGKIDIIISGLTIKEERKKQINFSIPYNQDSSNLFVLANKNYKSINDLKGKKVGAEAGTNQQLYVEDMAKKIGFEAVIFDKADESFLAFSQEKVDAIVENKVLGREYAKTGKTKIKSIGGEILISDFGVGIRKNDEQLLNDINKVIAEMKKSGELKKIRSKYFK